MTVKKTTDKAATPVDPTDSEAFPKPSKDEILEARRQGIKDAIQESTKEAYERGANEGYGENQPTSVPDYGTKDVMNIIHLVDMTPDALTKRIRGEDGQSPLTQAQIAGLIEVERSGKNRTDIVNLLCAELGIESPYHITAAGPAFTNDVTRLNRP